jgi:ATP-binding cassette, subfamily B, bacterial
VSRSAATAVVRLLPSVSRSLSLGLVMAAVLRPVLGFGFMLATGVLVGHIPDAFRAGVHGVLLLGVMFVGVCYAGQQVVAAAMSVVQTALGRRLDSVLADRLMRAQLRPRGIAHLDGATTQRLAERAAGGLGGARWRPAEAPGALAALASGCLGVALACAAVVWLSWWLGILLAVTVVWCGRELYAHLLRMTLDATEVEHTADYRRLGYEYDVAVSPASAKEIRVFGFAPWLLDRVQGRYESLLGFDLRRMGRLGIGEVASLMALVVVVGGGFVLSGSRVIDGELSLGAVVVLAQALIAPLAHLAGVFQALIDVRQSTRPVPALLELEEQVTTAQSVEALTPVGEELPTAKSDSATWHSAIPARARTCSAAWI